MIANYTVILLREILNSIIILYLLIFIFNVQLLLFNYYWYTGILMDTSYKSDLEFSTRPNKIRVFAILDQIVLKIK